MDSDTSLEFDLNEAVGLFQFLTTEGSVRGWEKNTSPDSYPGINRCMRYTETSIIGSSILDYGGAFLSVSMLRHQAIGKMKEASIYSFLGLLNCEIGCPEASFEPTWIFQNDHFQIRQAWPYSDNLLKCLPAAVLAEFFEERVVTPMESVLCDVMALMDGRPRLLYPKFNQKAVKDFFETEKIFGTLQGSA